MVKAQKVNPAAKKDTAGTSAAPGTKDDTAKKTKVEKVSHPLVGNEDSKVYPFPAPELEKGEDGKFIYTTSGAPDNFDPSKHKPLKKQDFAEDWQYYQHRIELTQAKIASFEQSRDEAKALGNATDRQAAKRLSGMAKRIAEIQGNLSGDNVDIAAIFKAAGVDTAQLAELLKAQGQED